jgi:hypothetical protein
LGEQKAEARMSVPMINSTHGRVRFTIACTPPVSQPSLIRSQKQIYLVKS